MTNSRTIGIIAAPEISSAIAGKLTEQLPDTLNHELSEETTWHIEAVENPLTGAADTVADIFQKAGAYSEGKSWDYLICLTDLPLFHGNTVVAADINESMGIGLISIPAFGWRPKLQRVERAITQIIEDIYQSNTSKYGRSKKDIEKNILISSKFLRRQFPISPARKIRVWMKETSSLHTRFLVIPRINGTIHLLSGMTYANNPLRMMSSLTNVIAIAFTTGAFGMIFDTMWKLSHLFSNIRMIGITMVAIIGMVIWVIIAHELWETSSTGRNKQISKLYNFTTAMTLLISVCAYYIVVFVLFFSTSAILIPPDFLGTKLDINTSVGIINYMKIAWFASSISTVAGAIGAGLANEKLVRDSTYGYRQNWRIQKIKDKKNASS